MRRNAEKFLNYQKRRAEAYAVGDFEQYNEVSQEADSWSDENLTAEDIAELIYITKMLNQDIE